jgi:hypothetical protein
MKYKMIAIFLALTVMSWAQTATQTAPSAPQQNTAPVEKPKCPCCDKMASAGTKATHACCAHHGMHPGDGKDMASCCSGKDAACCSGGKDAKSCMKGDKDAAGKSCCGDRCGRDKTAATCCGNSCGKEGGKGCCAMKTEKEAKSCCGNELRS